MCFVFYHLPPICIGTCTNTTKGKVAIFGADVTRAFCEANGLQMVVRSHQFVSNGFKSSHSGRLMSVFSARNYDGRHPNDGALLLLARDGDGCLRVRPKVLNHR